MNVINEEIAMHYPEDDEGTPGSNRIPWLNGSESSEGSLDREAIEALQRIHHTLASIEEQMEHVRRATERTARMLRWCIIGVSFVVASQLLNFVVMFLTN